jgi:DNA-directed RNA polymerase subunit RPC12/RpoP
MRFAALGCFVFQLARFGFQGGCHLPQLLFRLRAVNGVSQAPRLNGARSDCFSSLAPHRIANFADARWFPTGNYPSGPPVILRETNSDPKRMVTMRIELNCAACGNNHFSLDREMDDRAHVRCRDCGHYIGTLAELKERVAAEVLKHSSMPEFVSGERALNEER